jgi:hypothetical protein
MIRLVALGLVLLPLTGCTSLLHSNAPPEQVYYLRSRLVASESARPANLGSVRVGRPVAGPSSPRAAGPGPYPRSSKS